MTCPPVSNGRAQPPDANLEAAFAARYGLRGTLQDHGRAHELFERACEAGAGAGCRAAAETWLYGYGRRADGAAAARLFGRGCELGDLPSCTAEAEALRVRSREDPGARRRQEALLRRACEGAEGWACLLLSERVTIDHEFRENEESERLLARGERLLRAACDGGDADACLSVGRLLADRSPLDAPESLMGQLTSMQRAAVVVWRRSCALGQPRGCWLAGKMLAGRGGLASDRARADRVLSLLGRACDRGVGDACVGLGAAQAEVECAGTPRLECASVRSFARGCALGAADGCRDLAYTYAAEGDEPRALEAHRRACALGSHHPICEE